MVLPHMWTDDQSQGPCIANHVRRAWNHLGGRDVCTTTAAVEDTMAFHNPGMQPRNMNLSRGRGLVALVMNGGRTLDKIWQSLEAH